MSIKIFELKNIFGLVQWAIFKLFHTYTTTHCTLLNNCALGDPLMT